MRVLGVGPGVYIEFLHGLSGLQQSVRCRKNMLGKSMGAPTCRKNAFPETQIQVISQAGSISRVSLT